MYDSQVLEVYDALMDLIKQVTEKLHGKSFDVGAPELQWRGRTRWAEWVVSVSLGGSGVASIDEEVYTLLKVSNTIGHHATSTNALVPILLDGYVKAGGGASDGFTDGVLARESLDNAIDSSHNNGIIVELNIASEYCIRNYTRTTAKRSVCREPTVAKAV